VLTHSVADILEEIRRPLLSEVDWIIVEMAKRDGPLSLNPDGIWARVSRHVFRLRIPGRLRGHAQEALRRFAVRAWFWNLIRAGDLRRLVEAGYSDVQAMQILAHIADRRGYSPTIEGNRDDY
jgi:hypothetical protein